MKFDLSKIKNLNKALFEHSYVQAILDWSKKHSLPGFFSVPLYDVVIFVINEAKRSTLIARANSMSFSFFLSLFPAIIFLFSLATHFPIYETFQYELHETLFKILPEDISKQIDSAIAYTLQRDTRILSLGFILALFFASNGMLALMRGFEKSHLESFKKRKPLRKRIIAIALTVQLGILLISSVILIILGKPIINWLTEFTNLIKFSGGLIDGFRWLVTLLLFYTCISVIYRYGAAKIERFGWLTPGATLASILSILSSLVFSFYVGAFDTYNKLYGSIGAIIVMMLWIQINSFILLVGFELNASIAVNKDLKKEIIDPDDE